jgi:hypothetical protein
LQTESYGSDIEIVNTGNGKSTILDAGSTGYSNKYEMLNLGIGTYELTFLNRGTDPTLVHFTLTNLIRDWNDISVNGINASSALSLMTFSPALQGPGTGSSSGFMSVNPTPSGGPFGDSMAPLSASLFVTVNTGLMGQPFGNNQALAPSNASALGSAPGLAVGPTGQSLDNGDSSLLVTATMPDDDSQAMIENPGQTTVAHVPAIVTPPTIPGSDVKSDDASAQADARAVAQAELFGKIASLIKTWLAPSQRAAPQLNVATASVAAPSIAANESSAGPSEQDGSSRNRRVLSTRRADFGAAGLLTIGAIAYGMKRPIRNWWRQYGQLVAPTQSTPSRRFPHSYAPHKISRVTTRVRKPLQTR